MNRRDFIKVAGLGALATAGGTAQQLLDQNSLMKRLQRDPEPHQLSREKVDLPVLPLETKVVGVVRKGKTLSGVLTSDYFNVEENKDQPRIFRLGLMGDAFNQMSATPDLETIAMGSKADCSMYSSGKDKSKLFIYNQKSGQVTVLFEERNCNRFGQLMIASQGKQVLFSKSSFNEGSKGGLFVADAQRNRLVRVSAGSNHSAISADGSKVAYREDDRKIYVVDLETSTRSLVYQAAGREFGCYLLPLTLSPDGQKVAFYTGEGAEESCSNYGGDLAVVDLKEKSISHAHTNLGWPRSLFDLGGAPQFSLDSKKVSYFGCLESKGERKGYLWDLGSGRVSETTLPLDGGDLVDKHTIPYSDQQGNSVYVRSGSLCFQKTTELKTLLGRLR